MSHESYAATPDHPVSRLIATRKAAASLPGRRDDGAWLALAIEGGGMRGAVTGGMVVALEQLGLASVFDGVYGTSSGAIAGALFVTGQATVGASAYYEDLIGAPFISYRRLMARKPLVSLTYLFDTVMASTKSFDYARCIASPVPLTVVATSIKGHQYAAEYLREFLDHADLKDSLRASCTVPLACGRPFSLRGGAYVDGTLSESIPVQAALADPARNGKDIYVLALVTRPRGQLRREPNILQRRLLYPYMDHQTVGLGSAHLPLAQRHAQEFAMLARMDNALVVARPATGVPVGRLERDPAIIHQGATEGAIAAHRALTGTAPNLRDAIAPADACDLARRTSKNDVRRGAPHSSSRVRSRR